MSTRVEISKRLILGNSLSAVVANVLSVGLLVWLHQYLLQRVTAEEYALYPVIVAIILFVRIFSTILTAGIARYAVEAYSRGDEGKITEIVSSMMPLMVAASITVAGLGGLASWHVGSFLTLCPNQLAQARLMMALMVLGMAFGLLVMPFTVGFHVRQRFVLLNLIQLGEQVLRIALVVLLLFAVSTKVQWIVVAGVTANVVALVSMVWGSRRLVPALRFEWARFQWQTLRTLVSFGGWNVLGMIAHRLSVGADVIILNKLGTAVDVTAYHIGALPQRRFGEFMLQLSGVLQPAMTAMHATGNVSGLQRVYLRGNRYFLWVALLLAAPLIAFREELISLYVGSAYLDAALVILLLHLAYPLSYARGMLHHAAMATGKIRAVMAASVFTQVLNVAVTIYFVGSLHMGAAGAALGTLATSVAMDVSLFWPLGLRMLQIPFSTFLRESVIPGLIPGGVCLAACSLLNRAVVVDSWIVLGACCALAVAVYLLVAWAVLRPEDRQDARGLMQDTWTKLFPPRLTAPAQDQPGSATGTPHPSATRPKTPRSALPS